MSDALLTEISKKLSDIHGALTKAATGGAVVSQPKATAGAAPDDAAKKAAAKAAADKAAAKVAADKAAADKAKTATSSGPPAGTKAPGGKRTVDQVREIIRKVAADKNLGKETARDILQDDGGVTSVKDLKPENYDKVFEACEVMLNGEGNKAEAAPAEDEDDLM